MISLTGKPWSFRPLTGRAGFTFVECMAAVVILSVGIISIYQALLTVLNVEDYLSHRLYAGQILSSQAALVTAMSESRTELPASVLNKTYPATINNRPLKFVASATVTEFGDLKNLRRITLSLSWDERGKTRSLSQTFYAPALVDPQAE